VAFFLQRAQPAHLPADQYQRPHHGPHLRSPGGVTAGP
jgi:hypothetical protein